MRTGKGEGAGELAGGWGSKVGCLHYAPQTARPFKGSNLYAAASKQPADSSSGCLVNKAHAIAVQEASPSGRS